MKEISKNFLKTLKKVLTNENECDIIIEHLRVTRKIPINTSA